MRALDLRASVHRAHKLLEGLVARLAGILVDRHWSIVAALMPKDRVINPSQLGGIDRYVIDDGPARGVRALCVNTGGGLRYRVLVDRGLDIDQAFFNQYSLTFLTHKGTTAPTRGLDRGLDWLKGFGGGLLTSCGPFNFGSPCSDN